MYLHNVLKIALFAICAPCTQAAVVTFQASGVVENVIETPSLAKISNVSLGDIFKMTYSFEDSTPNTSPFAGSFQYLNVLRSLTIEIGTNYFDFDISSGTSIIGHNDLGAPGPEPGAFSFFDSFALVFSQTDGNLIINAQLSLSAMGNTPPEGLSSTALTSIPPDMRLFDDALMYLSFFVPDPSSPFPGGGLQDFVAARINSFVVAPSAVPVPAALWLLTPAIGGLGVMCRRRG